MDKMQEKHYEELFNQLLERGRVLHASNKRRIRIGMIILVIFTIIMILIRWSTGSDRATFLIVWVIGMFAISIYLVGIEYIDNSIEKTLEEVTDREADWDTLLPDSESMRGIVQDRIEDRREERKDRLSERRTVLQERYQSLRNTLEIGRVAAAADEEQKPENDDKEQPDLAEEVAELAEQAAPADDKSVATEQTEEAEGNTEQTEQPAGNEEAGEDVSMPESGDEA